MNYVWYSPHFLCMVHNFDASDWIKTKLCRVVLHTNKMLYSRIVIWGQGQGSCTS